MISFHSIVVAFITLLAIVIFILMIYSVIGLSGTMLFISISMFAASAILEDFFMFKGTNHIDF